MGDGRYIVAHGYIMRELITSRIYKISLFNSDPYVKLQLLPEKQHKVTFLLRINDFNLILDLKVPYQIKIHS